MHDLKIGERDVLTYLNPSDPFGAIIYFVLFVAVAALLSRALRTAVHAALSRQSHIDRTTISFLQQIGSALIWVIMMILYAHLIPVLRSVGTALLAGAGVASVVIGLAAQSTLGNLVAGLSITLYRPFRLGDTLQIAAPTGTETGTVEGISLGYTTLSLADGRTLVVPNSLAATQATLNLSLRYARWPGVVTIHVPRDIDLEAAQKLALDAATEVLDKDAGASCFLTRIDATEAQLELRFHAVGPVERDTQRGALLRQLAQRFAAAPFSKDQQRATFS